VWGGSPAIDHTTGLIYIGTGNNYTVPEGICTSPTQTSCTAPPADDYVDSLLALNLSTGAIVWALRTLSTDAWRSICTAQSACGPDSDFGSAPNLFTATINGVPRKLVGDGQKSGVYWAVDAATGELVWHTQVGPGGVGGGIEWGSATDGDRIYVAIANTGKASYTLQPSGVITTGGAFSALDPATGSIVWQTADPQGVGDFGFVSTANGVVYGGSAAGTGNTMYAMNAATGAILWRYASGGSVMGGAAIPQRDGLLGIWLLHQDLPRRPKQLRHHLRPLRLRVARWGHRAHRPDRGLGPSSHEQQRDHHLVPARRWELSSDGLSGHPRRDDNHRRGLLLNDRVGKHPQVHDEQTHQRRHLPLHRSSDQRRRRWPGRHDHRQTLDGHSRGSDQVRRQRHRDRRCRNSEHDVVPPGQHRRQEDHRLSRDPRRKWRATASAPTPRPCRRAPESSP